MVPHTARPFAGHQKAGDALQILHRESALLQERLDGRRILIARRLQGHYFAGAGQHAVLSISMRSLRPSPNTGTEPRV